MAGTTGACSPDAGRVPSALAASPLTTRTRHAPTIGTAGTGAAHRLKEPRRPASLMHAYIVVSLMAGVRLYSSSICATMTV